VRIFGDLFFLTQFAFFNGTEIQKVPLLKPLVAFKRKTLLYLVAEALRYRRKVEGSIPEGIIGIFYSHKPSGRTMGLGSN